MSLEQLEPEPFQEREQGYLRSERNTKRPLLRPARRGRLIRRCCLRRCRVDLRLGYYPGKKTAQVKAEVEALLKAAHARHPQAENVRYEIVYQGFQSEGLVIDMEQPAMKALIQCHQDPLKVKPGQTALTSTTDVKFFHLYGKIPSTCYGPVGENAHGIDEWVSIESMQRVVAVYVLFIAR